MATETFTLSCPLKTHDGEVTTLTLKEPTGRAFVDYGEPFRVETFDDAEGVTRVRWVFDNNKAFMRFLSAMTGVDDLILSSISSSDFLRLRATAAPIIYTGAGGGKGFTEPSSE